jgi:hypothetical protein
MNLATGAISVFDQGVNGADGIVFDEPEEGVTRWTVSRIKLPNR